MRQLMSLLSRMQRFIEKICRGSEIKKKLMDTPFGHFLEGPCIDLDSRLIYDLTPTWIPERKGFLLNGIFVEFTVNDVSLIMGLSNNGKSVDLEGAMPNTQFCLNEFHGHPIRQWVLEMKINKLVFKRRKAVEEEERLLKLCILYIFATFLFCQTDYRMPDVLAKYVEDINGLKDYNWAEAVYNFLAEELSKSQRKGRSRIGGCALILNVWLYEHLQFVYKEHMDTNLYPRIFRWTDMLGRASFPEILEKLSHDMINYNLVADENEMHLIDLESSVRNMEVYTSCLEGTSEQPLCVQIVNEEHLEQSQLAPEEEEVRAAEGLAALNDTRIVMVQVKVEEDMACATVRGEIMNTQAERRARRLRRKQYIQSLRGHISELQDANVSLQAALQVSKNEIIDLHFEIRSMLANKQAYENEITTLEGKALELTHKMKALEECEGKLRNIVQMQLSEIKNSKANYEDVQREFRVQLRNKENEIAGLLSENKELKLKLEHLISDKGMAELTMGSSYAAVHEDEAEDEVEEEEAGVEETPIASKGKGKRLKLPSHHIVTPFTQAHVKRLKYQHGTTEAAGEHEIQSVVEAAAAHGIEKDKALQTAEEESSWSCGAEQTSKATGEELSWSSGAHEKSSKAYEEVQQPDPIEQSDPTGQPIPIEQPILCEQPIPLHQAIESVTAIPSTVKTSWMNKYMHRTDYSGHALMPDHLKVKIDGALTCAVDSWNTGTKWQIDMRSICEVLFSEEVSGEVLDAYAYLIEDRAIHGTGMYKRFLYLSGDWVQLYACGSYLGAAKLLEKCFHEKFQDVGLLLVSVYADKHWFLMKLDYKKKQITYYNSLPMRPHHTAAANEVKKVLNAHLTAAEGISIYKWKTSTADTPKQMDSNDCGVFCMKYIEYIALNKDWDFSQSDMVLFRPYTALQLLGMSEE